MSDDKDVKGSKIGSLARGDPNRFIPDVHFTHTPCPDGHACRVLVVKGFKESTIEFRPWIHGKPKDFNGLAKKRVLITDACPTYEELTDPKKFGSALFVKILDHHANKENVALNVRLTASPLPNVHLTLDTTGVVCGALMVFRDLYPGVAIPPWLDSINKGDTDLIRTRTEDEIAYHVMLTTKAALKSVHVFDHLCARNVKEMIELGKEIVKERVAFAVKCVDALSIKNVSPFQSSPHWSYTYGDVHNTKGPEYLSYITTEVMHRVAKRDLPCRIDFLAIRWMQFIDDDDTNRNPNNMIRQISLRSMVTIDVAEIAKQYGGNGHPPAAGIQGRETL